jgi:hypothetical protein
MDEAGQWDDGSTPVKWNIKSKLNSNESTRKS